MSRKDGRSDGLRPILVLDAQADHAELIREALEEALSGIVVETWRALPHSAADLRSSPALSRPETVLVSLALAPQPVLSWLAGLEALGRRPRVFLLSGSEDRWNAGEERAARAVRRFEKSGGARFLEGLTLAVASVEGASGGAQRGVGVSRGGHPVPRGERLKGRRSAPERLGAGGDRLGQARGAMAGRALIPGLATPPVGPSPASPSRSVAPSGLSRSPDRTRLAIVHLDACFRVLFASEGAAALMALPADALDPGHDLGQVLGRGGRDLSSELWSALGESGEILARLVPVGGAGFVLIAGHRDSLSLGEEGTGGRAFVPEDGGHRHSAVTALLARELDEVLGVLDSLSSWMRSGGSGREEVTETRYARNVDEQTRRARAIVRRLRAIHAPSGVSSRTYLLDAADLVSLRIAAWRLLAPAGVEIEHTREPASVRVRLAPGIMAPALDALVAAQSKAVAPAGRILVSTRCLRLGEAFVREHPGARAGRFVRLEIVASRRVVKGEPSKDVHPPNRTVLELAIASAKSCGAYLCAQRQRGRSVVEVYLPVAAPERATLARRFSLLCIDDEAEVRDVCVAILREAGCRVCAVASGEEAVELYRAGCRYDLVLLDFAMERRDGERVFNLLRALDSGVRVVLCSGSPRREAIRRMLERGLLGLLHKPFHMKQLLEAVRAALGHS